MSATKLTKPMLAAEAEMDKIRYPVAVQPKYDGIRCIFHDGKAYTRSLKRVPNVDIQKFAATNPWLHGVDGEWIVGPPTVNGVYNRTHRFVMKGDTGFGMDPEAVFYAFDFAELSQASYKLRAARLASLVRDHSITNHVQIAPVAYANNREQLEILVGLYAQQGYEGTMIRDPGAIYKDGRATVKQGQLLKVKQWADTEGTIIGFKERMHNANEAFTSELGRTKRSSHKENKEGLDTLGAFVLTIDWNGQPAEVSVGTGLTDEQRQEYWDDRDNLMGKLVKFRYIAFGSLDAPRHPSFVGFRDEADMGE